MQAQLRIIHMISSYSSDPKCRNIIRDERGIHALVELLFAYSAQCILFLLFMGDGGRKSDQVFIVSSLFSFF